jgi:hypothetical protein
MASTPIESYNKPMDGIITSKSASPPPSAIFLDMDGRLGPPAPHRTIVSRLASTALAGVDTSNVQPPQLANHPCLLLCLLTLMACIITTCGGILSSIIGRALLGSLDAPGFDYDLTTAGRMGALGGIVLGVPGVAIELTVLALFTNRWKRLVDAFVHFGLAAATGAAGCMIMMQDIGVVTVRHAVVASVLGSMVLALCDNVLRRHPCDHCGGSTKLCSL